MFTFENFEGPNGTYARNCPEMFPCSLHVTSEHVPRTKNFGVVHPSLPTQASAWEILASVGDPLPPLPATV